MAGFPPLTSSVWQRLDERQRVAIPARFIEPFRRLAGLGDEDPLQVIICATPQKRLGIFPPPVFEKRFSGLRNVRGKSALKRNYLNTMEEQSLDKQNRIRVPALLGELFGLKDDVVVMGSGDYLEVVSKDAWLEQVASAFPLMEEQERELEEMDEDEDLNLGGDGE